MDENRRDKRYPANWVMVRLPESRPSMGRLCDISESGISFLYNADLEMGQKMPGAISLKYIVKNPFKVEDLTFGMEIVRKKDGEGPTFKYSYGAKLDFSQSGFDDATRDEVLGYLEERIKESEDEGKA